MLNNKITLVYTDCVALRGGDYTAAAAIASLLQAHIIKAGLDGNECILASSPNGSHILRILFGTHNRSTLHIHGIKIEGVILADFARSNRAPFVVNYIEVADCNPAPSYLVRKVTTNPAVNMLYIGLPHYSLSAYGNHANATYLFTGIGPGRSGIPVDRRPFADLHHTQYRHFTTREYGLIYFNKNFDCSGNFVGDYLRVATDAFVATHFIAIGDIKTVKSGVERLLKRKPYRVKIIDHTDNNNINFIYNSSLTETIKILVLDTISHQQMRSLMHHAIEFTGVAGMSSLAEAMAYGKIPFIPWSRKHEVFMQDYKAELCRNAPYSHEMIADVLDLLEFQGGMSSSTTSRLAQHLQNVAFCDWLSDRNADILKNCTLLADMQRHLTLIPATPPLKASYASSGGLFAPSTPSTSKSSSDESRESTRSPSPDR